MKKIFLLVLFFAPFSHAITLLEATVANTLASNNIIVNNSADPSKYRLGETISRSEAVGVALKVGEVKLPEKYFCKNYFRDVAYNPDNNWVCRAIEMASDRGIISRQNSDARPNDSISRSEALAVIMLSGKISYPRNINRGSYPRAMQQWQVDVVEGAFNYGIISSTRNFNPDAPATRSDVFSMIYNMRYSSKNHDYIAVVTFPVLPSLTSAPEAETTPTNTEAETTQTTPVENTPTEEAGPTTEPISSPGVNALADFDVIIPADIKVNTPFDITIKALNQSGEIFTDYTGTAYFDLIVASDSEISDITRDEGYTFTPPYKGVITLKSIVIKKPGTYEFDVYEIDSGLDIVKPFILTATAN